MTLSFTTEVSGPVRAVLAVLARWEISDDLGAIILGASTADYIRQLRLGVEALNSRDAQDRTRLLLDIYEGVFSLFKDHPVVEREWIRVPRGDLHGKSLLDEMIEGSQLHLIMAKKFVDHLNGR